MKLWTIQKVEFYEQLIKDKILYNDKKYIMSGSFQYAYDYMKKCMQDRKNIQLKDSQNPIFAWQMYDGECKKPDLRRKNHTNKGQKSVCLELEVPDELALLSNFDYWHLCLNLSEMISENEGLKLDKSVLEKFKIYDESELFDVQNDEVLFVQACIPFIKIDFVKKVQFFTGK